MKSLFFAGLLASLPASASPLGHIDFPVTAGDEARGHFLRGMLAMHSFWYDEARSEFRAATAAEPAFAMGYWGEAMTYYHPVWAEEDAAASRAAIARVPADAKVGERERAFLDSARILFGEGDRRSRWTGYAEALAAMHDRFPQDDEVATLYALSLLGTAEAARFLDFEDPSFRPFARAAAIALDVFARNPEHPGAAHYVIHAFDDPEHAVLALPAARRYAEIAPEASHARHMPSHIFVQLGMWNEATASNEAAWAASEAAAQRKKGDPADHDFHSLSWLLAVRLERGQRAEAREVMGRARADLAATKDGRPFLRRLYTQLVLDYVVETDDWARTEELLAPLAVYPAPAAPARPEPAAASGATCHPLDKRIAHAARIQAGTRAWIDAERALARKAPADKSADELARIAGELEKDERDLWLARELQARGRTAALRGDTATAVEKLKAAIVIEERTPPSGPVLDGATARERLGEMYLATGQPALALAAYRRDLELHPRRARALAGAAEAARAMKDAAAEAGYRATLAAVRDRPTR